jgi:hypothetical protein
MTRPLRVVLLVVVASALARVASNAGSGSKAKPATAAPKAPASWKTAPPVIPDWAPKKPSPEFVRAARVLKPWPTDMARDPGRPEAESAARVAADTTLLWPAAYELFGSLSDAQIERFLHERPNWRAPNDSTPRQVEWHIKEGHGRVLMAVKSMTPKQRRAFDNYVEAWRKARDMAYRDWPDADYLVRLYKAGARKDLSNVEVGFVRKAHSVGVISCITTRNGVKSSGCSDFAGI